MASSLVVRVTPCATSPPDRMERGLHHSGSRETMDVHWQDDFPLSVGQVAGVRHSIIHIFNINMNLKISLSFLGIQKDARRLSIGQRAILYRETHPQGAETNRMRSKGNGGISRRYCSEAV